MIDEKLDFRGKTDAHALRTLRRAEMRRALRMSGCNIRLTGVYFRVA